MVDISVIMWLMNIDNTFIKKVEEAHFRTNDDTGANLNALFIWNLVREHVGESRLEWRDLPAYCETHQKYHKIDIDYGCVRPLDKQTPYGK